MPTPLPPAIEARLDEYNRAIRREYLDERTARAHYEDTLAARAALSTEIGKLVEDAERWRVIRPTLRVDGDYIDGGEGWTPHVQFIICDEDKLSAISEVGHTWTVEGLVDLAARRSTPSETPAAASRPPAPRTAQ